MIKKSIKVFVSLILSFTLIACGVSTKKQEVLVNDFFTAIMSADFEKMIACCSNNVDLGTFSTVLEFFENCQDKDVYGQTFVDEANKFIENVCSELLVSYEILDIYKEENEKNWYVKVAVEMKDWTDISFDDYSTLIDDYQKENYSELFALYLKKGQQAMTEKIYGDIASHIFSDMTSKFKKLETKKETFILTLTQIDDRYYISKLQ